MANIKLYNPFHSPARFDPFGGEFDELFKGFFLTPISVDKLPTAQIPIDITEDDKSFKVRAEMPGFNKEDISVSVNDDQVSISAETKKEKEEKKDNKVVLRECYYGKQYRSFTLPQAADSAKTTAKYENGILSLELAKKTSTSTKKISVT